MPGIGEDVILPAMRSKESKILGIVKKELAQAHLRMRPEERLYAFAEHSRLLVRLFDAGAEYRKSLKPAPVLPSKRRKQ